jgi:lactate dehydrogenase-like 2-hydroxyacid dehydrogenase
LPGKQGAIIMHADTINDEFLAKADSLRALATFSVGYGE